MVTDTERHRDNDGHMKLAAENLELKNQVALLEEELRSCRAALQFASERADIDFLTGIYNRNGITRLIENSLSHESGAPCALCFLDLDNFKQVNDQYGHQYGDEILCSVVQTICKNIQKGDLVGRFGGDEFLIFMRGIAESADVAERSMTVCTSIREANGCHGMTASIGVACCPKDGSGFVELLEKADKALYRSKNGGKDQIYFYRDEKMEAE